MNKLQDTYYNIQDILITLYDYNEDSLDYRKTLMELEMNLSTLYKYFGIRKLKTDIGDFKKGEMVTIDQDEGGCCISTLDNKKIFYLWEENIEELFEE